MRHSISERLYTYWNNLRGSRKAPDRREIEPSDIREILGETFILEIDSTFNTVSFRLAGTRLCSAYGRELKGLGFLNLWDEQDNLAIYRAIQEVFAECQPIVISYLAQTEYNRFQECEMLLLPLLNQSETAARILGVAAPMEKQSWYGDDPIVGNKLKRMRRIDLKSVENAPSIVPELGENATDLPAGTKQVAHLTVIDGGAI